MENLFSILKKGLHLLLLLGWSCESLEPRRPLNQQKNQFLMDSAQRNKNRFAQEQAWLAQTAAQESELNFLTSEKGFWYALLQANPRASNYPNTGDLVTLTYQIENLDGSPIYSEEELGTVSFRVDQEDVIAALREGVKVLRPGEQGLFLFPSFMCFGYQGDFEKIGSNQPLRFTIKLVSLTKN
jgi:gliding motility-associated peptidyl-prolyl isomerase